MVSKENTLPNAQKFIAAFIQCNNAAKEIADQLTRGILLDTTHNLVQLINLLTLQFDNLLKQQQITQEELKPYLKGHNKHCLTNLKLQWSKKIKKFSNLYDIIGNQLQVTTKELRMLFIAILQQNFQRKNSDRLNQLIKIKSIRGYLIFMDGILIQTFHFQLENIKKSYHEENQQNIYKQWFLAPQAKSQEGNIQERSQQLIVALKKVIQFKKLKLFSLICLRIDKS